MENFIIFVTKPKDFLFKFAQSLKSNRHGTEVPEGELWMSFMSVVAERANEGLPQSTDIIPALLILNRGDQRSVKQITSIVRAFKNIT